MVESAPQEKPRVQINAMGLCGKIAKWSEPAVKFYGERNCLRDDILCHGKADFDTPVTQDSDEKPCYRISYYASCDGTGYMNMHMRQNLVAFEKYLQDVKKDAESILCVDCGCGPMTSGIALADVLFRSCGTMDYQRRVAYHGIDASEQVVKFAKRINRKHEVFTPDRFSVVQANNLCFSSIPMVSPRLAVLCLSFVLAPGTFKVGQQSTEQQVAEQQAAEQLAKQWNDFVQGLPGCKETRIIYINPTPFYWDPHRNWRFFTTALRELPNHERGMIYCDNGMESCEWGGHRPCHMAMIKGRRR